MEKNETPTDGTSSDFIYLGNEPPKTKNFSISEFNCKDGTSIPKHLWGNVYELMQNLQILRDHLGCPIYINSGYRPEAYNKKVGGVKGSSHIPAKAADIRSKNHTPTQVHAAILELIKSKKMRDGGVGKYPTFIHYDVSRPRRW